MTKQLFFDLLKDTWLKLFQTKLVFIEPQPKIQECLFECFVEIPIVGKKKFLLVMAMPMGLSYEVAATFFHLEQQDLSDADANDAMNELVNILAGQVQRQLNEDTVLDLPITLTKDQAQTIIHGIEPDWEVFGQHKKDVIYAGVFIADI